jgi:hypothetical protein
MSDTLNKKTNDFYDKWTWEDPRYQRIKFKEEPIALLEQFEKEVNVAYDTFRNANRDVRTDYVHYQSPLEGLELLKELKT